MQSYLLRMTLVRVNVRLSQFRYLSCLTSLGDWMGVKCLHCQPTWSYAVLFYGFIENFSESRGQPISLPTKGERRNYLLVINTESGQISREKWHLVFLRTKFLSSRSEFWMTTWDRFCSPSFPLSPFFLAMSESNACKSSYVQCVRCRAASTISESRAKVPSCAWRPGGGGQPRRPQPHRQKQRRQQQWEGRQGRAQRLHFGKLKFLLFLKVNLLT